MGIKFLTEFKWEEETIRKMKQPNLFGARNKAKALELNCQKKQSIKTCL